MPLIGKNDGRKVRAKFFLQDRSLHEDPGAIRMGSQVNSNVLNGITFPVTTPTDCFHHNRAYKPPHKVSSECIYTDDEIAAELDMNFMLNDAEVVLQQGLTGDSAFNEETKLKEWMKHIVLAIVAVGFAMAVISKIITGGEPESVPPPPPVAAPQVFPSVGGGNVAP